MALVLFDLNGTLLDPGPAKDKLPSAVRLAMAHTLAGDFRPFTELLDAVGAALPTAMPAFPDVAEGLAGLERQGHRLVVLTNSARETGEQQVRSAGLGDFFARVIGVDEVGAYKPDRRAYAYAMSEMGAEARDTWLVAAHDWDLIGAHGSGLRTAFVDRGGPRPVTIQPDRDVGSLIGLEL